ncbi:MAG: hypothetical protein JNK72_13400 [Myxococcales bacterium]|nr:hypothetical protein [Myxococcales bacterium]
MRQIWNAHWKTLTAAFFALGLGAISGVALMESRGADSECCAPGAACCHPGSPCCAHGAHASH